MPFSIMSRIMSVGQNALIIASKAANGPPALQLPKNQTKKQQPGHGKVGWRAVTSPINEWMGLLLKKMSLPIHKLDKEFLKNLGKHNNKKPKLMSSVFRAGYSRKSKLKQRKLETFTIAGEALLWKLFIQQMQSLPSRKINLKLF